MKQIKNSIFYLGIIGGFSMLIYWIISNGSQMEVGRSIVKSSSERTEWQEFLSALTHNLQHPLAILLAQIIVIILVARLFGWLFKKIGQPTVIGEIIAGIVLGPSFVGVYFPEFSSALFPVESLGNLQFLSQIGLILFMFVIGMELDLKALQNKAHDAIVISHASIVLPFALGVSLAYFIYEAFAPSDVDFMSFALFIGISMSITAFPVLARIVQERNMQKTKLGTLVITCAAADDVTAWCILAAVIAIVKAGSFLSSLYIIGLALIYVYVMIKVIRPFLKRIGEMHSSRENMTKPIVAIFFLTLVISAFLSEIIGIHALFGAFMAGAIMPENTRFRSIFIEKVEDVALLLLLPLFFVFTGLRTEIGLLDEPYLWEITGWIILVAVVGKFLGSAAAAKFMGQNWQDSLTIGALMNTRGLMELIVLNIGFDLGILSSQMFAMLVLMALITTFMTGPAIDLIEKFFGRVVTYVPEALIRNGKYNILISFGSPECSPSLLRLAHALVKRSEKNATITAMHLTSTNDLHQYNALDYEMETFEPIINESKTLGQAIHTLFKASNNMESEIAETANQGKYDLLIIGVGQSIYKGSILGEVLGFTTRFINPANLVFRMKESESFIDNNLFSNSTLQIMGRSKIPVAVLVDKNFTKLDRLTLIIYSVADLELMPYIQKFIHNSQAQITIIDMFQHLQKNEEALELYRSIAQVAPNHITTLLEANPRKDLLENQDLVVISKHSWNTMLAQRENWMIGVSSILIMKPVS